MRTSVTLAVALSVSLAAAGAGGVLAANPPIACARLLSAAEVEAAVGPGFEDVGQEEPEPGKSECIWLLDSKPKPRAVDSHVHTSQRHHRRPRRLLRIPGEAGRKGSREPAGDPRRHRPARRPRSRQDAGRHGGTHPGDGRRRRLRRAPISGAAAAPSPGQGGEIGVRSRIGNLPASAGGKWFEHGEGMDAHAVVPLGAPDDADNDVVDGTRWAQQEAPADGPQRYLDRCAWRDEA